MLNLGDKIATGRVLYLYLLRQKNVINKCQTFYLEDLAVVLICISGGKLLSLLTLPSLHS